MAQVGFRNWYLKSQMLSFSHERNLVDLIQVLNHDSVFHTPEIKSSSYKTK